MADPTIVLASLSDDKLKESINSLVKHVNDKMEEMVESTNSAVKRMEDKLKSLGNLKIDTGGSNDGGTGRRTQQHEKLTKAVNDASEAVSKETQKLQDLQQSLSGASDREQNFVSQKERAANTIAQENELLKQQEQELSNLKSQQSSFGGASQQTTASIEKQREAVANLKNEVKYWQSIVSQLQSGDKKARFNSLWIGDTTSKQGHDILDVANKLYYIMQKLGMETEKGSASTGQAVKVVEQLAKYYKISREEAEKLVMSVQESPLARGKFTTHYDTRFGLDNLTMQKKDAEDSALRLMIAQSKLERQTDDLALANKRLADSENSSTQSSQQKAQIDAQIAAKEKEITETKGRIAAATKEQSEADKNASQAAKEKANIQSQVANQEKQVAEAKKQLTTATQQHADAETKSSRATKEKTMTLDQQASAINTAIQSEKKYTEEIRKQAAAIRATKEWQEKGHVVIGDINYYDKERANVSKRDKQLLLSLEEQIVQAQQNGAEAARRAAQETRNQAQAQQQVQQAALGTARIVESVHEMQRRSASFSKGNASIPTFTVELESAKRLSDRLKELREQYNNMNSGQRFGKEGQVIAQKIREIARQGQILNNKLNRPTKKEVFGLSEKTLDDIAYKMRQLASYRSGLNATTQTREISSVNDEYNRLKKRMDEVMQKNQQMIASNTALGRSWNYMKNRLAFYFTVGASTQFVKNLIEVRSQYEMNERALGILINSAERGTQIFNELSQMALVSPYTLIELSSAAKQLTAYDIAAKDVINTTRRLADMSAAVGIPIERLTYALGQVKAYGYLNARDARMFANAGIPLVKNLSEYYTELEGRLVSTADIYDRIKNKQIGYEEVMSTISKMTDEGGKFFDFQAKMAETLKVQLANLTLAWNNMLNDMGEESQGVLVGGIGALKQMFLHWKDIEHILTEVVVTLGAYKAYQLVTTRLMGATSASLDAQILAMKRNNAAMLEKQSLTRKLTYDEAKLIATQNQLTAADYKNALSGKSLTKQKALLLVALNKNNVQLKAAIVNMGLLTAQEAANVTTGRALAIVFKSIGISMRNAAMAMIAFMVSNWWMLALGGIYELYHAWDSYNEHVAEINRSAAEHAKEAYENIKQYLEGDVISALQDNLAKGSKVSSDAEGQKAWDEMREKIELSSSASNVFIAKLMQIDDINERLSAGFGYLNDIQKVAGVMQTLEDDAVKTSTTTLGGLFGEGLKDDLQDFLESRDAVISAYGDMGKAAEELKKQQESADVGIGSVLYDMQEFAKEVKKTTDSIYDIASREGFNTNQQREFFEREISEIAQAEQMSAKETRIFRIKAEDEYFKRSMEYLNLRLKVQKDAGEAAMAAETETRIKEFKKQFGANKAMQESFFTWLTEKQDHAVKNMLRGKTQEEIKQGDWLKGANGKWVEEMARKFSQEYGVSFDGLRKLVMDANTWHINIPVFFQTIGQPLTDVQRDYEARTGKKFSSNPLIKDAKTQVEIIDILKKKQKEVANEMETARKAGDKYWENNKERFKKENDALIADIHAYNALTDAEEKANKKSNRGSKKDALLDTLKQEISLVEKLQGDYDKLTKSGASQSDALETIRGAYGKTIRLLNAQLGKYGLPQLDISQLITGKDPNKTLAHFKQTLDTLVSKGMLTLERSKELEAVVEKFTLSAKTYNLDMITKGLNNELDRLKEEYELAVELDANPELGDMFLDMFGIDPSDFSHSIDDYMFKVQSAFEKARRELGYGVTIDVFKANDEEWKKWGERVGLSGEALDNFKARFVSAQGVANKWAQDVVKQTQDLQYKLADNNGKIAIEEEKLAVLRQRLAQETNDKQKALLELQIQDQQNAINKLKEEILQLLPTYNRLFGEVAEHSASMTRKLARDYKNMLVDAQKRGKNPDGTYTVIDPVSGKSASVTEERLGKEIKNANKELGKTDNIFKKIKESLTKGEDGIVDWVGGIENIGEAIGQVGDLVDTIGNVYDMFGNPNEYDATSEALHDIATTMQGVNTAAKGIGQIASGDYIGGAISIISGLTSALGAWFDNSDKEILAEIKESERAVKKLELAYIDLEHAINDTYGYAVSGAKRAAIANKKLQLEEAKRQLQLEQSRSSKNRDEDKIIELRKQVKELEYDIKESTEEIIKDLLGITSVGDTAEQLVTSMIEAFRKGEDYMLKFDESFDNMIDNMIMKAIVGQVIGERIQEIFDKIKENANTRGGDYQEKIDNLAKEEFSLDTEIENEEQLLHKMIQLRESGLSGASWEDIESLQNNIDNLKKLREENKKEQEQAQKDYSEAIKPTPEDVDGIREDAKNMRDEVKSDFKAWMEAFGITFGEDSTKKLSTLQQGIQGITEDTAGALEGITNGISQQSYLQSDLLTQIRDTILGFDLDIQMGVLSEILLQLQSSYQIQMSIRDTLQGWSNASGMAVRVEMV